MSSFKVGSNCTLSRICIPAACSSAAFKRQFSFYWKLSLSWASIDKIPIPADSASSELPFDENYSFFHFFLKVQLQLFLEELSNQPRDRCMRRDVCHDLLWNCYHTDVIFTTHFGARVVIICEEAQRVWFYHFILLQGSPFECHKI